jgi:hypothetical protein
MQMNLPNEGTRKTKKLNLKIPRIVKLRLVFFYCNSGILADLHFDEIEENGNSKLLFISVYVAHGISVSCGCAAN